MKKTPLQVVALLLCMLFFLTACGNSQVIVGQKTTATATAATEETAGPTATPRPKFTAKDADYLTQTWVAAEIPFTSAKTYEDPFNDVDIDVTFTSPSGVEYKMPGYWDGDSQWCVRFAPTEYGIWTWKTVCTDTANTGLQGKTGTLACNEYTGNLDIYKHGFVTTRYGYKYFTYDDGTPFFYLGDTHWNMYAEELDAPGSHAGSTGATSHFKYIVDTRAKQGYTVYQSEPISSPFSLTDGKFGTGDAKGFKKADQYYQYIAKAGLVHANAEFFYSGDMKGNLVNNDAYLEKISRYWVARFGAYPVMWTMAQECDNDFYFERGSNTAYDYTNNPWVKVAQYFNKYDPYKHPLTAHQEYTGKTTVTGQGAVDVDKAKTSGASAFTNVAGHSWWGAQWSPSLKSVINFDVPKDYWASSKVSVDYEGRYCYLWTKDFGSRAQGWMSYLNGIYGYGYGAIDIWLYMSTYDISTTTNDGVDTITPDDKATYWSSALFFGSAFQVGYMKHFFSFIDWWKLVPNFNDGEYFTAADGCFYSVATDTNKTYVGYFYNKSTETGTLHKLDASKTYVAQWFNPRTGDYAVIASDITGQTDYSIPAKPDNEDWVLMVSQLEK